MAAPYPNPQTSALYYAIADGTNVLLSEINTQLGIIETNETSITSIITNINTEVISMSSQADGLIVKINVILDKVSINIVH